MRLFIISIVFMLSLTAQAFIGPVNRSTNLEYDGSIKTGTVENHYMNIKNVTGATLALGTVVTLDTSADDGASATTSATAGRSPLCIIAVACDANKLCKCQNYGVFDSARFDSTANAATAGSRWYMSSANAGYVSARTTDLATEVPGGIFFDSASASGTIQVFIGLH